MKTYFQSLLTYSIAAAISVSCVACQQSNLAKISENPTEIAASDKNNQKLTTKGNSTEVKPSSKPKPKHALANAVCPDPKKPCHHKTREFEDWELPFRLPAKLKPNVNYKSAAFYAVVLKNYRESECDVFDYDPAIETERNKAQKLFPTRKFFAEYSCPNLDTVVYDFAGKRDEKGEHVLYMDYIAVYAGETSEEANKLLNELREKFPQAEIKKMTANYTQLEQ